MIASFSARKGFTAIFCLESTIFIRKDLLVTSYC